MLVPNLLPLEQNVSTRLVWKQCRLVEYAFGSLQLQVQFPSSLPFLQPTTRGTMTHT